MSQEDQELKNERYWQVIEFLDKQVEEKKLAPELLLNFKTMIRDNKYVSTYIRALKIKMEELKSMDDFIRKSDNWANKKPKDWDDLVNSDIRNILENHFGNEYQVDPIKIINNLIRDALAREGKICDFRDSVLPENKIGRCESDDHYDNMEDAEIELTEDEKEKFNNIMETDGWTSAMMAFDDKYNPADQLLHKTLYSDDDTAKFDDTHAEYVCQTCLDNLDGDCEVSCDME